MEKDGEANIKLKTYMQQSLKSLEPLRLKRHILFNYYLLFTSYTLHTQFLKRSHVFADFAQYILILILIFSCILVSNQLLVIVIKEL